VLELLSGLDLNTKIGGLQYSGDIPANHIISQDPPAGSEVKKGRSVRIVISRGPASVQVPNLKGLSLDQAETLLVKYHAHPKALFEVPRHAFYPRPKVGSMMVELDFGRPYPEKAMDEKDFKELVKGAFALGESG
jgi:hypothetical protein